MDELQLVEGYALITGHTTDPMFLSAKTDLTGLYKNSIASAVRGIAIINKQFIAVRDEVTGSDKAAGLRWNMLTPAQVKITGKRNAELTQNGKKLRLEVLEPAGAVLKTWSTEPPNDYDAPNPGTVFLGFEVNLPAGIKSSCVVLMIPEGNTVTDDIKIPPLNEWK
jgi:hypothetical protein